ncbi:MAG: MurT ligase domain-containing protein [Solirubrobacterales bacterium]
MTAISPFKVGLARGVGALSRGSGRGGGTSLPGRVLLYLQDDAISRMAEGLSHGSIVISATNGKTTTASLLASILRHAGIATVHNSAGANMPGGIATALLEAGTRPTPGGRLGLFEVDEAWAATIAEQLRPKAVVLANLFRDQLDRYGELETLADSWARMIAKLPAETRVVLNADDPLLAQLAGDRDDVVYFGIDDRRYADDATQHAADSKFCRRCSAPLVYSAVQLGHLGDYRCDNCGLARPGRDISVSRVEMHGMAGSDVVIKTPDGDIRLELPLPGLYNVYNAAAATAAAYALGFAPGPIAAGLAAARAVFGRVERIEIAGHSVAILLIKNPTGANEVIRTIGAEASPFDLWIALNDNVADGRDVSWVWDADFERLAGKVHSVTCSGTRAEELALRLAYAGIERDQITVDGQIERSFDDAVSRAVASATPIFALPTYTSLLELRTAISRRGDAPAYWQT